MSERPERPANCGACAFWRKLRETDGLCCRHAPDASHESDQVAHFPQTRITQWCGEGVAAAPKSIGSRCSDCVFWCRPRLGLQPLDRGDMPVSWWDRAGLCARNAPRPIHEPGLRGFWRATLDQDFCGEGEPRSSRPAS